MENSYRTCPSCGASKRATSFVNKDAWCAKCRKAYNKGYQSGMKAGIRKAVTASISELSKDL